MLIQTRKGLLGNDIPDAEDDKFIGISTDTFQLTDAGAREVAAETGITEVIHYTIIKCSGVINKVHIEGKNGQTATCYIEGPGLVTVS